MAKGLGTRHERWLALERHNAEQVIELSAEQAAFRLPRSGGPAVIACLLTLCGRHSQSSRSQKSLNRWVVSSV